MAFGGWIRREPDAGVGNAQETVRSRMTPIAVSGNVGVNSG